MTLTQTVRTAPPVLDLTRKAIAEMMARGDPMQSMEIAAARFGQRPLVSAVIKELAAPSIVKKAAVAALGTVGGGAALAPEVLDAGAFVELLRPATVLGRMTGMRPVPFNIKVPRQTAAAAMGWAGQGRPKVATKMSYDDVTLGHAKCGGIVVFTEELVRLSGAEPLVQADLIAAIAQFQDRQLLDPSVAAVLDISPAAITNGMPGFVSSGADAASIESDLSLLVGSLNDNGILFRAPYWVMLPRTALHLAKLRTSGQRVFPDVGAKGGSIWGIPVLVTANLPVSEPTGDTSIVVLLDAAEILLAEGTVELDASRDASLQMDTDPGTGAASLVSLWQQNLLGLRMERWVNWAPAHPNMAATLTDVAY